MLKEHKIMYDLFMYFNYCISLIYSSTIIICTNDYLQKTKLGWQLIWDASVVFPQFPSIHTASPHVNCSDLPGCWRANETFVFVSQNTWSKDKVNLKVWNRKLYGTSMKKTLKFTTQENILKIIFITKECDTKPYKWWQVTLV